MKLDYASRKAKRKANKLRRTYPLWSEGKSVRVGGGNGVINPSQTAKRWGNK